MIGTVCILILSLLDLKMLMERDAGVSIIGICRCTQYNENTLKFCYILTRRLLSSI